MKSNFLRALDFGLVLLLILVAFASMHIGGFTLQEVTAEAGAMLRHAIAFVGF